MAIHVEEEEMVNVTLGDFLSFIAGASIIPPMGFDNKPLICLSELPFASTCRNLFYLPVIHSTYEVFWHNFKMLFGMACAVGFGRV